MAIGGLILASRRPGLDNQRAWELQGILVEIGAARVCGEKRPEVEFTVSTDGRQWWLSGVVFPRVKDGEALL
jgi:hypothetical protein